MSNLKKIFNKRAEGLTDHDPWRYGESLSEKADMAELEFITDNLNSFDSILDMGCGTGRHALTLASRYPEMRIHAFDFAENTINVLNNKIKDFDLKNIETSIHDVKDIKGKFQECSFSNILSIGLVQYLFSKNELEEYLKECSNILKDGGLLFVKQPTSLDCSFFFEGYSELLKSEYKSLYRTEASLMESSKNYFDLIKKDIVFSEKNVSQEELNILEAHENTRQTWFLFQKKNR